jgi:outer membrane protein OmpA-like peptidoglycan-associated protein
VRVQRDSALARDLGAAALTQGDTIHFAPGRFAPGSAAGRALIGHELAHIEQQRSGRVVGGQPLYGASVNVDPALERDADLRGAQFARSGALHTLAAQDAGASSTLTSAVIQRFADPEVCEPPVGLACQVIPGDAASVRESFTYAQNVSNLNPVWRARTDAIAAQWIADGSQTVIRVDGYASAEGPCDFNWSISCRRAEQVANALMHPSGGAPGVAADHIDIFAHGESDHAGPTLAANRRSTVMLPPTPPGVPVARGPDQRVPGIGPTAEMPDADLGREIGFELDPTSRPVPLPPQPPLPPGAPPRPLPPPPARTPWDGAPRSGDAAEVARAAAARARMQAELFGAYDAYLTHFRPTVVAALTKPRVGFTAGATPAVAAAPATGVVDIANAAHGVLVNRYGAAMDAAAATSAVAYDRAARRAGPAADQNIFDPYRAADRSAMTASPNLAPGVAWWLFENDVPGAAGAAGSRRFATDILARYHYSTADAGAEQFRWDVANAYAAAATLHAPANRQQLVDYRLTQWNEKSSLGITLLSAFDAGANRAAAERLQRWTIFKTAVHEVLHLNTHPSFSAATRGRGAMMEGFTEMFSISTLNTDVLPAVRAGTREPLRRTVEGLLTTPSPLAGVITDATTPAQYAEHRAAAERIRDGGTPAGGVAHAGIGEAAARAAYFQGHVEYLGLAPDGNPLAGLRPAGAPAQLRIPPGIAGLNELAQRSGVPRAQIEADNPGIAAPLPATAVLAGAREHIVVVASTTHPRSGLAESAIETRAQIATQHGVSEADLVRANPDLPTDPATHAWPPLVVDQRVLIPRH